ncbi:MAG: O-antigen ligase family protein [Candidatus Saccharimonadales bacterium]
MVAAILALLPFHAFFTTWAGSNTGHLDLWRVWKEAAIVLIAGPTLWLAWRQPSLRQWLKTSWLVRLYLIYILVYLSRGAWALAAGRVNSEAFTYSLLINLRFVGFFIVCYLLAALTPALYRNWRKILLLPAVVVVTFGLAQKLILPLDFLKHFGYGADTIPAYQTVDNRLDYQRIQSTLRGANPLGAYMALVIPTVVATLRKKRSLLAVAVLAAGTTLFLSQSRSAWIGAGLALAVVTYMSLGTSGARRKAAIALIAVSLLITGMVYTIRNNDSFDDFILHTSEQSTSPKTSNEVRIKSLKNGVSDIVNQPLGGGPGTAGPASVRNSEAKPRISENYFLQTGQEVGIAGLLLFLALNAGVIRQLWQRKHTDLVRVLLASWVGITFINLVSHAWADDTVSLLWWGLAGIALAPVILADRLKT